MAELQRRRDEANDRDRDSFGSSSAAATPIKSAADNALGEDGDVSAEEHTASTQGRSICRGPSKISSKQDTDYLVLDQALNEKKNTEKEVERQRASVAALNAAAKGCPRQQASLSRAKLLSQTARAPAVVHISGTEGQSIRLHRPGPVVHQFLQLTHLYRSRIHPWMQRAALHLLLFYNSTAPGAIRDPAVPLHSAKAFWWRAQA